MDTPTLIYIQAVVVIETYINKFTGQWNELFMSLPDMFYSCINSVFTKILIWKIITKSVVIFKDWSLDCCHQNERKNEIDELNLEKIEFRDKKLHDWKGLLQEERYFLHTWLTEISRLIEFEITFMHNWLEDWKRTKFWKWNYFWEAG
jgi:hypothetical protein